MAGLTERATPNLVPSGPTINIPIAEPQAALKTNLMTACGGVGVFAVEIRAQDQPVAIGSDIPTLLRKWVLMPAPPVVGMHIIGPHGGEYWAVEVDHVEFHVAESDDEPWFQNHATLAFSTYRVHAHFAGVFGVDRTEYGWEALG